MSDVFGVISPGPLTTVQDAGRPAFQHMGVPVSGALDRYALRVANWLVGNAGGCAVLEATLAGVRLEVLAEADIALTGAASALTVNGVRAPGWASVRVRPGDVVDAGVPEDGCRSYLAVAGGIDVPPVMGSRATYLGGRLGGFNGRALEAGDVLRRGPAKLLDRPRCLPWFPLYGSTVVLRAVPGPQDGYFRSALETFFDSVFTVSAQANRMGYRLEGPVLAREPDAPASIVSEPIVAGNVQVPADGQAIILLNEQTLGGYAKIATVITPDLFKVAQAKPGDTVRFLPVTVAEAGAVARQWAAFLSEVQALLAG
ncbi:MAG: biotin-dependent carboxyltransferase [Deltaproteobacteria bacterium]|nr:biotin-dependent carboxyltransferase [Deltaproteobacteria bacterium]